MNTKLTPRTGWTFCPTCDGNTYIGRIGVDEKRCPTCDGHGVLEPDTLRRGAVVGVLSSLWCEEQTTAKANLDGRRDAPTAISATSRMVAYEEVARRLGLYDAFKEALPL